jgi:hypothetical protein
VKVQGKSLLKRDENREYNILLSAEKGNDLKKTMQTLSFYLNHFSPANNMEAMHCSEDAFLTRMYKVASTGQMPQVASAR